MCGIVGLFLKDSALAPRLGALLSEMLVTMTDRGPDSAGIALYGPVAPGRVKLVIQTGSRGGFAGVEGALAEALAGPLAFRVKDSHAVAEIDAEDEPAARTLLATRPELRLLSAGEAIEIYKEVGLPRDVAARFGISGMAGSHGIGHTRMATESAVTTLGAHPFSTGADQCLVHNGSLSNHHNLRRRLARAGVSVQTENDSEVAAAYLSWRMSQGASLGEALEAGLSDLDGFFTFVVGTRDGFGVVRDPIACKPAVMA
ncbi:MAG: glutamine amidotransferase, partial [Paracoccaceae bacterium]